MKTVRFSALVDKAGHPDTHLSLVKPEEDKILQKAIKTKRVMTVFQQATGSQTDHGEVGFQPGKSRQYFIFPRSVGRFAGRRVVGIKYELLEGAAVPKRQEAIKPGGAPKKAAAEKAHPPAKPTRRPGRAKTPGGSKDPVQRGKVVKFPKPSRPSEEENEGTDAIDGLKAQVRRAMAELEKGRQVAAFNLLKRIVED